MSEQTEAVKWQTCPRCKGSGTVEVYQPPSLCEREHYKGVECPERDCYWNF